LSKDFFGIVLGIVQDGGYPHVGSLNVKQQEYFQNAIIKEKITCLGIVDRIEKKSFLIDATPHLPYQLDKLSELSKNPLSGILITHTHWGHIGGLGWLSKEGLNHQNFKIFSSCDNISIIKKYCDIFEFNTNIFFEKIKEGNLFHLTRNITAKAVRVPHRAKGDTFGYVIATGDRKIGYFPDCDSLQKWKGDFLKILHEVDVFYLDGTFWNRKELDSRNINSVPHPFVENLIEDLKDLSVEMKRKLKFIHLNQTNPLLDKSSSEFKKLRENHFGVAEDGELTFL
tara:strand:+ start:3800 stop:4651 length:852 start_codon:yes stop_codon:yes gene_type:complete